MIQDVQTIVVVGDPSGSFVLSIDDVATPSIPAGATPSQVQAAIGGDCVVEYATVNAYVITKEPADFFTLFPKNSFGNQIPNHDFLPEYTTTMANEPESTAFVRHSVTGTATVTDVQTLVITGTYGLFSLTIKHDDGTLEHTPVFNRGVSAATIDASLNVLLTVEENGGVTVTPNTAVAYRVTFPHLSSLPILVAAPTFTGGTYPFVTVVHTSVGGPLIPTCCSMPSVTPSCTSTDNVRIVTARLTR